eukprot:1333454-Pleurochrysis_carterae.AAC.1
MSSRKVSDLSTESHCLELAATSPSVELAEASEARCSNASIASTLTSSGAERSSAVSRRDSNGEM